MWKAGRGPLFTTLAHSFLEVLEFFDGGDEGFDGFFSVLEGEVGIFAVEAGEAGGEEGAGLGFGGFVDVAVKFEVFAYEGVVVVALLIAENVFVEFDEALDGGVVAILGEDLVGGATAADFGVETEAVAVGLEFGEGEDELGFAVEVVDGLHFVAEGFEVGIEPFDVAVEAGGEAANAFETGFLGPDVFAGCDEVGSDADDEASFDVDDGAPAVALDDFGGDFVVFFAYSEDFSVGEGDDAGAVAVAEGGDGGVDGDAFFFFVPAGDGFGEFVGDEEAGDVDVVGDLEAGELFEFGAVGEGEGEGGVSAEDVGGGVEKDLLVFAGEEACSAGVFAFDEDDGAHHTCFLEHREFAFCDGCGEAEEEEETEHGWQLGVKGGCRFFGRRKTLWES